MISYTGLGRFLLLESKGPYLISAGISLLLPLSLFKLELGAGD